VKSDLKDLQDFREILIGERTRIVQTMVDQHRPGGSGQSSRSVGDWGTTFKTIQDAIDAVDRAIQNQQNNA
jgi:hypothetical protein